MNVTGSPQVASRVPIRWPSEAIWEAVAPSLDGFTVEVLPQVDSTNSELMRRARAGQPAPILLVAERQMAGRGRMGRQWISDHLEPAGHTGQLDQWFGDVHFQPPFLADDGHLLVRRRIIKGKRDKSLPGRGF